MSLQMSQPQSLGAHAVRSIDISAMDRRRLSLSNLPDGAGQGGITLSLSHLDIALAIDAPSRGLGGLRVSAERLAAVAGQGEGASLAAQCADPVMRCLSDALAATEDAQDERSAILADALRLAILTRKLIPRKSAKLADDDSEAGLCAEQPARTVRSLQKWRLKRVQQYVDDNLGGRITLQDLASVAGLSRMHFAAQFRAAVGMRPHEYLLKRRIERAQELLKQADIALVDVALTVGFQTQAHFTTVFKRFVGDTPNQWRSAYLAQVMPLSRADESVS